MNRLYFSYARTIYVRYALENDAIVEVHPQSVDIVCRDCLRRFQFYLKELCHGSPVHFV